MKQYVTLSLLLFCLICTINAQIPKGLIDSVQINNEMIRFEQYVENIDSLNYKKDSLHVFFIYETFLKDDDIDEDVISKQYYLSGRFLQDLAELKNAHNNAYNNPRYSYLDGKYFSYYFILIYDESKELTYRFTNRLERIFWEDQKFYNYIGKLYFNDQIDCAFFYPSIVEKPSILFYHYESPRYLVFAVKGKDYYVIRSYTDGDDNDAFHNNPASVLISLEDYIDCCWEEMTNLPRR